MLLHHKTFKVLFKLPTVRVMTREIPFLAQEYIFGDIHNNSPSHCTIVNRPSIARTVLQTPM